MLVIDIGEANNTVITRIDLFRRKSKDARAFVDACDGQSVMGLAISCILDPFGQLCFIVFFSYKRYYY